MSSSESPISQGTGSGLVPAHPPGGAKIMAAYGDCRGRFYLMKPEIHANQRITHAIDQVRAAMEIDIAKMVFGFALFGLTFCEPVVETATISAVRLSDSEAGRFPRQVFLSDREVSPELTALFDGHGAAFWTTARHTEMRYQDMADASATTTSHGNTGRVLAVSYKLKQGTVLRLVVLSLVVFMLISLVLGLKVGSIEVAFTAFGAMTLVMTVPLGVIFGMVK